MHTLVALCCVGKNIVGAVFFTVYIHAHQSLYHIEIRSQYKKRGNILFCYFFCFCNLGYIRGERDIFGSIGMMRLLVIAIHLMCCDL